MLWKSGRREEKKGYDRVEIEKEGRRTGWRRIGDYAKEKKRNGK